MATTEKVSLKDYNTFALPVCASQVVVAESIESMIKVWQKTQKTKHPWLVLGEGSNVLFLEDFLGTVVINRLKGIQVHEEQNSWLLHVGAGEKWHNLVKYTLSKGIPGLENLALIPGLVGSAPIQNIGAYGLELKDVCEYVDVLDLNIGTIDRMEASRCEFGYRESIFKHQLKIEHVIVGVGLRLTKAWKPKLNYGELAKLSAHTVTPTEIFSTVCETRRNKLPSPYEVGNAGSFFKNPIVDKCKKSALQKDYPNLPCYEASNDNVKLAAGWLIEQCGLKGFQIGGAAVHDKQALVLINKHNATSQDLIDLARYVRRAVGERFDVWLEPEVRFMAANGEVDALEILS